MDQMCFKGSVWKWKTEKSDISYNILW
jgi:hypothetical protein